MEVTEQINNEKNKSLIEVFEMYVTVTSDLIRQLAFEKITIDELLREMESIVYSGTRLNLSYLMFDSMINCLFT